LTERLWKLASEPKRSALFGALPPSFSFIRGQVRGHQLNSGVG
jgi:hypothetical protein